MKIIPSSNSNNIGTNSNNDGGNAVSDGMTISSLSLSLLCPYFYANQCNGGSPSSKTVSDACFLTIEDLKTLADGDNNDSISSKNKANPMSPRESVVPLGQSEINTNRITKSDIEKLQQWMEEFLTIESYDNESDDRFINASTKGNTIIIGYYLYYISIIIFLSI
jgi:hypothetical protein